MSNVYEAPSANFSTSDTATETTMFALNGRIGRVRFIAYSSALWILGSIAIGVLMSLIMLINSDAAATASMIMPLAIWIVPALVARRRLHDLGLSALYLLGVLIPFINLYFVFILLFKRGDEGGNEFGPEPAPNDRTAYWLAFTFPLIAAVGILAAIALPAYQSYTKAARAKGPSASLELQRQAADRVASIRHRTLRESAAPMS